MKAFFNLLALVLLVGCMKEAQPIQTSAVFDYLGQPLPGDTAVVFVPDVISREGRKEGNARFSVDGEHFYFLIADDTSLTVMTMRKQGSSWSQPELFSPLLKVGFSSWEPSFTPDGRTLFFVSNRPPGVPPWNGRIWKTTKNDTTWAEPALLDLPIDTERGLWFPTSRDGHTVYFGAYLDEGFGKSDMYVARYEGGTYVIENLGGTLNTVHEEWDPYISSDGSFLLFASDRPGGFGGTDNYISFKRADGSWTVPQNLGAGINSADYDVAATLSPDGAFIFMDRPKDGDQDIYWASSAIIERLRAQVTANWTASNLRARRQPSIIR